MLQYFVHTGDLELIRGLLGRGHRSKSILLETNFLGQNVFHVAVTKPRLLSYLLSSGLPKDLLDCGDWNGTTPLMYAAAHDKVDSVILLLLSGANQGATDSHKMEYIDYALVRNHFELIQRLVQHLRAHGDLETAQNIATKALMHYVCRPRGAIDCGSKGFKLLLALEPDLSTITAYGNTPLHLVKSVEHAELILASRKGDMKQANLHGHTPAMILAWFRNLEIMQQLNLQNADLSLRDDDGHTVLEHVLMAGNVPLMAGNVPDIGGLSLARCHERWARQFRMATYLIECSASISVADKCACDCSTKGCSVILAFLPRIYTSAGRTYNLIALPWLLELYLLATKRAVQHVRTLVMSLYRRQRFDELGLTHSCCLTGPAYFGYFYTHFYPHQDPHASAIDLETNGISYLHSLKGTDPAEVDEINFEQEEGLMLLDAEMKDIQTRLDHEHTSLDDLFVSVLARRWEFIQRGARLAQMKSGSGSLQETEIYPSSKVIPF